jgi:CubicO group peptidase (beta-lactamase class C family)
MHRSRQKQALLRALARAALLFCSIVSVQKSHAQTLSPQSLKALLEGIRQKHDLPALGAAVMIGDQIIVATCGVRKYGDPTPVTDDDKFHLGSCTKSMTATLTAMLVEEGTMAWDTTIESVFPELADSMREEYRSVTVRQLLQHRGGLPQETMPTGKGFDEWRKSTDALTQQRLEYLKLILRQVPEATPGTKMVYSNAGYVIAGAMIERCTGKSWEELMRQRLFKPLDMKSAGFGWMATDGKIDQPWPHSERDGKWQPVKPGPAADNPLVIGPAGTVHSSLGDWGKYARLHLRGMLGKQGFLAPQSLQQLYEVPQGSSYAMGWNVLSRPWAGGMVLQHNGSNVQNYSVLWLAPLRNYGVLVATNCSDQANIRTAQACDEVASAVVTQLAANSKQK